MTAPAPRHGRPGRPRSVLRTIPGALRDALLAQLAANTGISFPCTQYQNDPVGFAYDVLGVELWSRQIEILESVRDNEQTAVSSGHKLGKSFVSAVLALWWYCSFPRARVRATATTDEQVNGVFWREITYLVQNSGTCVPCKTTANEQGVSPARPCKHSAIIDGRLAELASTGLKADDQREIVGYTVFAPEANQGTSGNVLVILDEGTGISDAMFEAIETSIAGAGRIFAISNPTKNRGWFFDAFHHVEKKKAWNALTVSTEENPNAHGDGDKRFEYLARRSWIDRKIKEHGPDSAWVMVRIRGLFALKEDGKIFSLHDIGEAEKRWRDCVPCAGTGKTLDDRTCTQCRGTGSRGQEGQPGPLFIGVDPAGPTGSGDETVFAIRRGKKVLDLIPRLGLDEDAHLKEVLALIDRYCAPKEMAVVVIDRSGEVGSKLHGRILSHLLESQKRGRTLRAFHYKGIMASDHARRMPNVYPTMRDELAANLETSMKEGLALPEDAKLSDELNILEWHSQVNGSHKLTHKKEIRRQLGRSPDRYDALALACYVPDHVLGSLPSDPKPARKVVEEEEDIPFIEDERDPYRRWDYRG